MQSDLEAYKAAWIQLDALEDWAAHGSEAKRLREQLAVIAGKLTGAEKAEVQAWVEMKERE